MARTYKAKLMGGSQLERQRQRNREANGMRKAVRVLGRDAAEERADAVLEAVRANQLAEFLKQASEN